MCVYNQTGYWWICVCVRTHACAYVCVCTCARVAPTSSSVFLSPTYSSRRTTSNFLPPESLSSCDFGSLPMRKSTRDVGPSNFSDHLDD